MIETGVLACSTSAWATAMQGTPGQAPPQAHMLKVRELVAPSLAPEPDEDASEAFLTAALRGNSTRVRRVRAHRCDCDSGPFAVHTSR